MEAAYKQSVQWYDANINELLPKYRGKFVGVSVNRVCGAWDDFVSGLNGMVDAGYAPGKFIVQQCVPFEEEPVFHCHTDNVFRNPKPLTI